MFALQVELAQRGDHQWYQHLPGRRGDLGGRVVPVAQRLGAAGRAVGDLRPRAHRDAKVLAGRRAVALQRPEGVLFRVRRL